ncbi:hypothetical protein NC653_020738 [Populus alba x Populus x berolinensis]|uniref:Uncharacterized protein n=1 Tax=Populus alba x Populus x berolinensis TaxID=444605 RepID=A0AAD6MN12_9ROSI|nr:hypothetical protein NC653_020738 [Populus alba x Populus x berolinensis]
MVLLWLSGEQQGTSMDSSGSQLITKDCPWRKQTFMDAPFFLEGHGNNLRGISLKTCINPAIEVELTHRY